VHGDLWSGNVYWSAQGPALIDPAPYWGSREVDLAFTELFGRFDSHFYSAYNEAYPVQDGYEERKQILNLYHLMTHSNLFGGHYISSAYSALTRI
jgi:fructosamine-3-kinase